MDRLTDKENRKPAIKSDFTVNDFCRLCKCSFKIKYGPAKRVSTENLFRASNREGSRGVVLASLCEKVGVQLKDSPLISSRVCNPCARKIRNFHELHVWFGRCLSEENPQPLHSTPTRGTKRLLPTSVSTPDRSPLARKLVRPINGSQKKKSQSQQTSRRGLFCGDDLLNEQLSVDDLDATDEAAVKVVVRHPGGTVDVCIPKEKKTKTLIKNIALKRWKAAANGVLATDGELQEELHSALQRAVGRELKGYCRSDSVLRGTTPDQLAGLSTTLVAAEARIFCPLWNASVTGACGFTSNAINQVALCTSVAARRRNASMSAMAYRISSVLVHGGIGYQDIKRLNHLGIGMSPDMVVCMQRQMGANFDARVMVWKQRIEKNKVAIRFLEEILSHQVPSQGEHDMDEDVPINLMEYEVKSYPSYTRETLQYTAGLVTSAMQREIYATDDVIKDVIQKLRNERLPYYKIVGDNVDMEVHARIQTKDHGNQSLHWTHQFAELSRVSMDQPHNCSTGPTKAAKDVQLVELLPSTDVQAAFRKTWAILISRVVCKYLGPFRRFSHLVIRHIPHQYSKEMAQKSTSCCLDLFFKNANIAGEMGHILKVNQDKYVPVAVNDDSTVEVLSRVAQHGDQLYEERGRNVQWAFGDGENQYDRLEGIRTEFADWHAKFTLYKVENDIFLKPQSVAEVGTTCASINRAGKTNAAKGIQKHYNEYKEFHEREIEAHICASFMHMSSMSTMEDQPSYIMPDDSVSKCVQQKWLLELCEQLVDNYIFKETPVVSIVQQTQELQDASSQPLQCRVEGCNVIFVYHSARVRHEIDSHGQHLNRENGERDEYGYYYCRGGCGNVFVTKTTRNRHERTSHEASAIVEDQVTQGSHVQDPIFNYHSAKLCFGLILFEFNDVIKEGDGQRLYQLYKLALLIYKSHGNSKYAYAVLLYLSQITAFLPQNEATDLKWNRFHNRHGGKGKNIPLDLRKEQQNKVLKTMWKGLGSNITQDSASRLANALDSLEDLMTSIDNDCKLQVRKGYHSTKSPDESVRQITLDLMGRNAFNYTPGRDGYQSFPNFDANILRGLDYRNLHKWMSEHLHLWGSIYERRT